jgi:hypothetical protein
MDPTKFPDAIQAIKWFALSNPLLWAFVVIVVASWLFVWAFVSKMIKNRFDVELENDKSKLSIKLAEKNRELTELLNESEGRRKNELTEMEHTLVYRLGVEKIRDEKRIERIFECIPKISDLLDELEHLIYEIYKKRSLKSEEDKMLFFQKNTQLRTEVSRLCFCLSYDTTSDILGLLTYWGKCCNKVDKLSGVEFYTAFLHVRIVMESHLRVQSGLIKKEEINDDVHNSLNYRKMPIVTLTELHEKIDSV